MKKHPLFILFVVFISYSTILNAQLKVGVGAGFQSVSMFDGNTSFLSILGGGSKLLPYVGLSIGHPLSKKISLFLEGDFVTGSYFPDIEKQHTRNWRELNYTLVHTSVVFRYQLGRKFSIGTGVLVYFLGATTSRSRIVPIAEPPFVRETNFDSSLSYGIPLSFGYQFKKLFLELQWNYGFRNNTERNVYGKIQTLSLGLFYQFEINK